MRKFTVHLHLLLVFLLCTTLVRAQDVYQTIGIIGSATANGWDASTPMKSAGATHQWTLTLFLTQGEAKFRANDSWDVNWGSSAFPSGTGSRGGANIPIPAASYYTVTFNDQTGAYGFQAITPTAYTTVGLIGSATPGGWDNSTAMTQGGDGHTWTLTGITLTAGEVKFRANNSWDVNWGGGGFPSGTGVQNGNNITARAGTYNITFNDVTGDYFFEDLTPATYETVGIIGSATPAGWDNSTPMQKGADEHTWTLQNLTLTQGEAKFRANNAWDVNWGGSAFPTGTASGNGPNIPVTAGTYNVSFNDITLSYAFQATAPAGGIVTLDPAVPTADEPVTITYDATKGTSDLGGAAKVYLHSGVVLSGPEGTAWSNVVGNYGQDDGIGQMSPVPGQPNKWTITLPSVRQYYGVAADVPVFRLGMVFRNENGTKSGKSAEGGDIYVNLNPGDFVRFTAPAGNQVFAVAGNTLALSAEASTEAENIRLEINTGNGFETVAQATNAKQINYTYTVGTVSSLQIRVSATIGSRTVTADKNLSIVLRQPNVVAALPAGLRQGINYQPNDPGKATLVLLAPGKEFVYVVGDFNNWQLSDAYQMKQTPDGKYFWLEISNLQAKKEYVFQYWVDGTIKVGDPYADKVADPYNDGSIPASVYPNPVPYNRTQDGIATVLQTGQEAYVWKHPQVAGGRPAHENLVVYELLVRDFLASHSYRDLADTLAYLKRLGVNAIELMPIMEFEGNESWGYNPSYMFAPDKYYGTKNDLKAFIDEAHEQGFVVILDIVLNHQFGQSPLVRMYFDEANGRPVANSPWFNPVATHPFNVGYDFNHESPYTKQFVDDVNRYWLQEFKIDGYRFDLSKGFTQNTGKDPNDVGAWSAYDQSRIDILKRMTDVIRQTDPQAYVILEHLAVNDEEKVLADYGMLLWGNFNRPYSDVINGKTGTDLNGVLSGPRGWSQKNLIAYMESHDEERVMYEAKQEGGSSGDYNIRETDIALERVKLASAFYYTTPGPKMLWQFGELGYDFSINFNGRTGNKPIPWGSRDGLNYDKDPDRLKLYKAKAAIINLVNRYSEVFENGEFAWTPTGALRKINIRHDQMEVAIVGNFGLSEGSIVPGFRHPGTWYDFFTGQAVNVTSLTSSVKLAPGEFHIYLDKPVDFPEPGLVKVFRPIVSVQPGVFTVDDQIKITFDASVADPAGTLGLVGVDKVYLRAGIVSESGESTTIARYAGSADKDDGIGLMTKVPGNNQKWTIVLRPRTFFGVQPGEGAFRIGMYFRSADGKRLGKGKEGQPIFVNIQQQQQVVTVTPSPFTADSQIKITFDASKADPGGTAGLVGADKVYMHSGVVLNDTEAPSGSDWRNVVGNYGQDDGVGQMTKVPGSNSLWEITLTPRQYYGLSADASVYYLAMVFRNGNGSAEGKGPGGSDIFIRLAPQAPAAPTALTPRIEENLTVSLSWTDNSDNELGFLLERKSETQSAFQTVAILDADENTFADTSTIDGVTYVYRVKALSAFSDDSPYAAPATADLPLLAPKGLTTEVPDLRRVELQWQDRSAHETAYVVERAVQKGNKMGTYSVLAELPANRTSYADTDVRPGHQYYYRVRAKDSDEFSAYSETIRIRPVERLFTDLKDEILKSIRMFPNPTRDWLTIFTSFPIDAPIQFRVVSMQGQVMKSCEIDPQNSARTVAVDLSDLQGGLYILQAAYKSTVVSMRIEVRH